MEEDADHSDTVTLLIENVPLKCSKEQLVSNSNYFKVMFEGNFLERDQSIVTLEEIDLKSMSTILTLFGNHSKLPLLAVDDLLQVLQTSSMLQFETVQEHCLNILTERLGPQNCIKIWFTCELHGIRPLYLKAKNLALIEFDAIKETNALLDLDLTQLHSYLANTMLQCKSELDVFTACMRWFYENGDGDLKSIIKLLSCVDFRNASEAECREMQLLPDVHDNKQLRALFSSIMRLKREEQSHRDRTDLSLENRDDINVQLVDLARTLVSSKKRSKSFIDPVLFVKKYLSSQDGNQADGSDREESDVEVCYDAYKRKRKYLRIGGVEESIAALFIYDMFRKKYVKCISVPEEKYMGCEGFHIVGYKEQIFFFGGEVTLGSGHWNLNFWVYDTIRERWERKTRLPSGRRHFQSCICGPYLYIIGGTGSFRIIQDNMFWYNYIDNIWSTQLLLPCSSGQLRCCNYNDQLLLLNMHGKHGYLYSNKLNTFAKLDFADEAGLVKAYPPHFSLFAYAGRVYVKSATLIEFELREGALRVRAATPASAASAGFVARAESMESVVCDDEVVTLYKCAQTKAVQLEVMSMHAADALATRALPAAVDDFAVDLSTKLFALRHHYKMVGADVFVNELADVRLDCDSLQFGAGSPMSTS